MLKQRDIDYFNHGKIENNKFWKRMGGKPNFENKTVLDFGCGKGALAVEIAQSGAKKVVGIDLEDKLISFAKENVEKNFASLSKKIEFRKSNILLEKSLSNFDYIVSKDTFEHTLEIESILHKMHEVLNDDGKALIGFGPLYNFYNGDHGRTGAILPWFHILLPEKLLIERINKKNELQISSVKELGLNKYSFKEYLNFFNNSKFKIDYLKSNLSDHPAALIFNLLRRIKILEEYCTYNIYCILRK